MSFFNDSRTIISKEGFLIFIKRIFLRLWKDIYSLFRWVFDEINPTTRYHLKDLNHGLLNATKGNESIRDKDLLRIIRAFRLAKEHQKSQPKEYQVIGDWAVLVDEAHKDLTSALDKEDLPLLRQILGNFGRDKVSRGLSLSGNLPRSFLEKIRILHSMNRTYVIWKKMTDLPDSALEYPKEIGNMHGIDAAGRSVMLPAFHQSYFAARIGSLLREHAGRRTSVVEIGGGYGSLAYHLFQDTPLNYTYVSLDIPEVCVLSSYFLMSNFPGKKFLLYGERDGITGAVMGETDCIILPNFAIRDLPDRCCDLVFNSHSMSQMDPGTIREYLRQIDRICLSYFYHANNETEEANLRKDGRYISLNTPEFELPKEKFKKIFRFPELIRDDGYLSPEFSTWEYLYQRFSE